MVEKAAQTVADALGKPVSYVCAEINYSKELAFAGSKDKTGAWIELASIGFNNRQAVVDVLTEFAVKNLGAENNYNVGSENAVKNLDGTLKPYYEMLYNGLEYNRSSANFERVRLSPLVMFARSRANIRRNCEASEGFTDF